MPPMDPDSAEVKAAGCVVHRRGGDGVEVALVHRPRYDDWSLPKGKLDAGESWEDAAVREVEEEMGTRGALGEELEPVFYRDRKDRAKAVRYWLMEAGEDDDFEPSDEVDEVLWAGPRDALERLSYDSDRDTLTRALELIDQ